MMMIHFLVDDDIGWTLVWTMIMSFLVAIFFGCLSQLVHVLLPNDSRDLVALIEIRFAKGCLAAAAALELIYVVVSGRILLLCSITTHSQQQLPLACGMVGYLILVVGAFLAMPTEPSSPPHQRVNGHDRSDSFSPL
jgi:hypothetical protein